MIPRFCSVLVLLIGLMAIAHAAEEPLPVFILAGQSNMVGLGIIDELPDDLRAPMPEVLVFQAGEWLPLEAGVAPAGKRFGPEVGFAHAMAEHLGKPFGIIKHAVGGTNLAVQWSPESKSSGYTRLVKLLKAAQDTRPIVVVGMLWMQGEADSKSEDMANAYMTNLLGLITAARNDFGNPDLPFVCGRVNPPPGDRYAFSDAVRAAQAGIDLPQYQMLDCDDVSKGADNLHYNAIGQVDLGKRFAAAMVALAK